MDDGGPEREEILILAPTGQDGRLIAQELERERFPTKVVSDIGSACARLDDGTASALIIAEEALTLAGVALLNEALARQAPWSDVPIILMTGSGGANLATLRVTQAFSPAGNLTLLERPFRRITLSSVIQVALRSRRRQHHVRRLLEKQAAATRVRDEFISIASHELKTPLTSLKLQTQLSQRLMNGSAPLGLERTLKLIESTAKQVDRLARLVEDMLDVSRINSGKLVLKVETFDLRELVHEAIERIMPQLEDAGCPIRVDADRPVVGSWDRYRIEQVLNNLLTNAMRYCPGKPILVEVSERGAEAELAVQDQGVGIPPENQARIFNRFERAVDANSISGLGLGLYICREIAEAHHGTISVESEPGRGSRFKLRLQKKHA